MTFAKNEITIKTKNIGINNLMHQGCLYIKNNHLFILVKLSDNYMLYCINSGVFCQHKNYCDMAEFIKNQELIPLATGSKIEIEINNSLEPVGQTWINSSAGIKFKKLIGLFVSSSNTVTDVISYICGNVDINTSVIIKWMFHGGTPSLTFLTRFINFINNRLNTPEATKLSYEIIEETKRYKHDRKKV